MGIATSPVWKRIAAVAFLAFLALWAVALVGGLALPLPREPAEFVVTSGSSRRDDGLNRPQSANNVRELGLARESVRRRQRPRAVAGLNPGRNLSL